MIPGLSSVKNQREHSRNFCQPRLSVVVFRPMETLLTVAIAIIVVVLVIKLLGGLLRIIITVGIILLAAYLLYQFLLA